MNEKPLIKIWNGEENVPCGASTSRIAPVEVETKTALSKIRAARSLIRQNLVFCSIDDKISHWLFVVENLIRVMRHAVVLTASFLMNIVASRTGIMNIVVAMIIPRIKRRWCRSLISVAGDLIRCDWEHLSVMPSFVKEKGWEDIRHQPKV